MNNFKVMLFKVMKSYWFLVMISAPIIYGVCLFLYLGRYDNSAESFYNYTVYFNCALPFGISLMVGLYVKYEEQIGHFNHLLQLPNRMKWSINAIILSVGSVLCSTLVSCLPLWLLVGNEFSGEILLYVVFTTLFSLPMIIILWFIALKINANICFGIGVFLTIFLIYFGAQSLGDTIWIYIPLLYGTRYVYELFTSHYEYTATVISLYFVTSLLLSVFFIWWFNRWEGRVVNE